MRNIKTGQIIKNIAADHGVTKEAAENAIYSVFEYIREVMSNEVDRETTYFPTLRIPGFATFFVRESTKERFKEINRKHRDEFI